MKYEDFCVQVQRTFGSIVFETNSLSREGVYTFYYAESVNSAIAFSLYYNIHTESDLKFSLLFFDEDVDLPTLEAVKEELRRLIKVKMEALKALESEFSPDSSTEAVSEEISHSQKQQKRFCSCSTCRPEGPSDGVYTGGYADHN